MGLLEGTKCYCGGPIEHNTGPNWRIEVKEVLEGEFGIKVFDPFTDPKQQWFSTLEQARKDRDYKIMRKIARKFVRKDLCWVDRSDFLITNLPYRVVTTGSHHELTQANDRKKPTLLVCTKGKQYLPFWYHGFIKEKYLFGNWHSLYNYLKDVELGKYNDDERWHYVLGLI